MDFLYKSMKMKNLWNFCAGEALFLKGDHSGLLEESRNRKAGEALFLKGDHSKSRSLVARYKAGEALFLKGDHSKVGR